MALYKRNKQGQLVPVNYPALKGADGVTPNLTIGTVTTLEPEQQATVTIGGTKENPVLDFGIPSGPGGIKDTDKVDYMGNQHESLKETNDANVEFVLGEFNTAHYEGQHITATNTIERQVKQAELKGCTLVNYLLPINQENWSSYIHHNGEVRDNQIILRKIEGNANTDVRAEKMNICLHPYTSYLFFYDVVENTGNITRIDVNDWDSANEWHLTELSVGTHCIIITTGANTTKGHFQFYNCVSAEQNAQLILSNLRLITYQEDMENWDIPYFEGMASITNPMVTMTGGKNLFDKSKAKFNTCLLTDGNVVVDSRYVSSDFIEVAPSTWYTSHTLGVVFFYDSNKTLLSDLNTSTLPQSFTTPVNCKYIRVRNWELLPSLAEQQRAVDLSQVEQGNVATTYEPYKSKTITLDGNYRRIGNTYDILDLVKGEKVKRIEEMVLNGNENWSYQPDTNWNSSTHISFRIALLNMIPCNWGTGNTNCISDKFKVKALSDSSYKLSEEFIGTDGVSVKWFNIKLLRSRLNGDETLTGLKNWLSKNPITVQYILNETVIETVDLKGQKVYSYDGTTHYTCSAAEGSLAPTLSIDVPTNLPALVSRQRATIQALTVENQEIKAVNEAQDTDIALNQEAINFMLFQSTSMMLSEQTKGTNMIAVYLANQILKGRLDYTLVVSQYGEFKEDIDTILITEDKQELIK